jgi:acyl-CoA reductase-like NAD-dependent aldehyde dehydrogenase
MPASKQVWLDRLDAFKPTIRNLIAGRLVPPSGAEALPKLSPRDGRLLYESPCGDPCDVLRAVAVARTAFDDGRWSRAPIRRRKAVLLRLGELIESHCDELAFLECIDVGKPISSALHEDVPAAAGLVRETAESADKLFTRAYVDGPGPNMCYQVRNPIGVVAAVVGWNFPLLLASMKVAPALAMGNSVVLKPSEWTALSAARLAELALEAGVPEGVFNVVHGTGRVVGSSLALHDGVGLLAFTGSSATGKELMVSAGTSNMKRLLLECGGKSPYIVFEDCAADLDGLAKHVVASAFPNQGERCTAGARLLVQESIKEQVISRIIGEAQKLTPADPLDPVTAFGALINREHLDKVLGYIEGARLEGADLVLAGRCTEPVSGGCYLGPNIFTAVQPHFRIAREEIFGPVLSVFSFRTEEEAIALANGTRYGLAAFVATCSLGRAQRMAQRLEASQLIILSSSTCSPGGVVLGVDPQKESGFGAEGGFDGLAAYSAMNTVYVFG